MKREEALALRKGDVVILNNTNRAGKDTNCIPSKVIDIKTAGKRTLVLIEPLDGYNWSKPVDNNWLQDAFNATGNQRVYEARSLKIVEKKSKIKVKVRRAN